MGTVSPGASFGGQLEALVVQRFARAAEDELLRRGAAGGPAASDAAASAYCASLRELGGLARQRLQGLCVGLLDWRAAAVRARAKELPEPAHEGPARVADELLAEALGAVMPAYDGSNLDPAHADAIENILLDLVKATGAAASHSEEPEGGDRQHRQHGARAPGRYVFSWIGAQRMLLSHARAWGGGVCAGGQG